MQHDTANLKLEPTPLAQLTGKDGATTMTGLILVRSADKPQNVNDLKGCRILFGNAECDKKFAGARTLLEDFGVELMPSVSARLRIRCGR